MKSFRLLLALGVCAAFAGILARAETTPPKDQQPAKCDATCDKPADKACCTAKEPMQCCVDAAKAGKVCEKCNPTAKCEKACDKAADKACCTAKEPMQCCVDAAKAGKVCEKCNPPAKK